MRSIPLVAILLAVGAALLPLTDSASAAGGPILQTTAPGEAGIESPDGEFRYVPIAGSDGATVLKIAKGTGELASWTRPSSDSGGAFGLGVPQVAGDGSVSGLSADGGTLVLISADGPIDRLVLVALGTNKLRVLNRITLDGQYSFDAISPDGRTAYVVEYPKPFRYDRYRVLKLDLRSGRLAKDPVPDEDVGLDEGADGVAEEMRGLALSQVTSPDGRWAYTLYDGGGEVPFIHALDTVGDRAVCAFMPELADLDGKAIRGMRVAPGADSGSILVTGREGAELASVDTASFAVSLSSAGDGDSGSTVPETIAIALAVLAAAAVAASALRRRRTRKIAPDPEV